MNLTLPPLPYAPDALEPHLSRRTLEVHHGQHHAAYVAKARALVQGTPLESASLEDIVVASAAQDRRLFDAAAQAWNHAFFWESMCPGGGGAAVGQLAERIVRTFGSQAEFERLFASAAVDQFGSGWAWLVTDGEGDGLRIVTTGNAETPLVSGAVPLLTVDVWEHAYYLDWQQRRAGYVEAFLRHLVDWKAAERRLAAAVEREAVSL